MSCRLFCKKPGIFSFLSTRIFFRSTAPNVRPTNEGSRISYDHGASDTKFLHKTLGGLLTEATHQNPDKIAVVSCHQSVKKTYEQLHHDLYQRINTALDCINTTIRSTPPNVENVFNKCGNNMPPVKAGRRFITSPSIAQLYVGSVIRVVACSNPVDVTNLERTAKVIRFAAGLLTVGLGRGDNIAILSPNHYEWIVTQFATATAGLALTTVNPAFTEAEVKLALNKAECKAIVMSDGFKGTNYFGLLSNIIPDLPSRNRNDINCKEVPNLKSIITFNSEAKTSTFSFEDILNSGEEKTAKLKLESQMKIVQPDDIAFIQFTSGTTGSPKAVLLSHHMIFNNAYCIGKRLQYTSKNDRICVSVPLFHCFGNIVGTTAAVCYGISVVLPSPGFNAKATMKAIDDEKCTMLYGTPTMFIDILHNESFDNFTFNSLRGGVMAASNCPVELLKAINSKMNMKDVCVGYGTTENTAIITLSHPEDPLHIRCSSVGNTIDHVEVKVMDSNGCTVKRGEMGELCSRGYQVMQGYLNEPEKTKEVFDVDRWYKTGDLATMDDQGYIRIVGRIKDMIIRGGENIYPREIEEFLHTHPDIAEAQVFGIPDERLGEIVCSWIKLKINRTLTEEQTREFCKDNIAKFKIPKHVLFVSEFPTTQSGKIQKFKMREIMIKELASSV